MSSYPHCFESEACLRRSRISWAALLVKVTAVIRPGSTPLTSTRYCRRAIRVLVFPAPGPAMTATARSEARTASSCRGFREDRISFSRSVSETEGPSVCFSNSSAASADSAPSSRESSSTAVRFTVFVLSFSPAFCSICASSSAENRESCPSRLLISSSESRPIFPYSPS